LMPPPPPGKMFFQIQALFQFFFFVFCYTRDLVGQGY